MCSLFRFVVHFMILSQRWGHLWLRTSRSACKPREQYILAGCTHDRYLFGFFNKCLFTSPSEHFHFIQSFKRVGAKMLKRLKTVRRKKDKVILRRLCGDHWRNTLFQVDKSWRWRRWKRGQTFNTHPRHECRRSVRWTTRKVPQTDKIERAVIANGLSPLRWRGCRRRYAECEAERYSNQWEKWGENENSKAHIASGVHMRTAHPGRL